MVEIVLEDPYGKYEKSVPFDGDPGPIFRMCIPSPCAYEPGGMMPLPADLLMVEYRRIGRMGDFIFYRQR